MPKTLLIEAGFLGLPGRFFGDCARNFSEVVEELLERDRLDYSKVRCWVSSNRIGVLVEGLADVQHDCVKEVRGPKAAVAYDLNNLPTPAAKGFASAQGLELKDLYIKDVEGERFLFVKKTDTGKNAENCIQKIADKIFSSFPFNSSPWKKGSLFPQPPLYICGMLDSKVAEIEFEGLKAESKTGCFNFPGVQRFQMEHASDYPVFMKKVGMESDFKERKKLVESKIRAMLPDGCRLMSNQKLLSDYTLSQEEAFPVLLKFKPKYLEMPDEVLLEILSGQFRHLTCESSNGKLLPFTVALASSGKFPGIEETVLGKILNRFLDKVYACWERDKKIDLAAISCKADELENELTVSDSREISKIATWLSEHLDIKINLKELETPLKFIKLSEVTEVSKLVPGTGVSIILKNLEINGTVSEEILSLLRTINLVKNGKTLKTECEAGKILSLAYLLRDYARSEEKEMYINRVLNYLVNNSLRFDLFYSINRLFPGLKIERKDWMECFFKLFIKETESNESICDGLVSARGFDPVSFREAYLEWGSSLPPDGEYLIGLKARIGARLPDKSKIQPVEASTELEKELEEGIFKIEELSGVNYLEIYRFFIDKRVDIEACLMDLPPILDDTNDELTARIYLLKRLSTQLVKLPFIRKEKKLEKN